MVGLNLLSEFSRKPKLLVADDDWLNRDLLQMYLTQAGCEVRSAADGVQAWQAILQGFNPDLVISDVQMPGMDGYSLCQNLKNREDTRFTPVIIITALDAEEEKLRAIQVGADDFITKPYNAVMMLTRVRSLLRIKHLHDELESRNRLLRQVLNRYVDEEITNIILTDPEKHLRLGGETAQVSVLFADLRGFTPFTEMSSARQVVEMLNTVFDQLTSVIFETSGTFDKYLGDAIMAFYGAPIKRNGDVLRSLRCALKMQERFQALQANGQFTSLQGLGVGVHFGEAIVGNIGTERAMDYTVIGDTVNTAKRLQEVAAPGEILVTRPVLDQVPQARTRPLEPISLRGKADPIPVFALLGLDGE